MSDKTSANNSVNAEGSEENEMQKDEKQIAENTETVAKEAKDSGKDSYASDVDLLSASDPDRDDTTETVADRAFDAIYEEEERIDRRGRKKRAIVITASIIGVILVVYFGGAVFFMSHFAFGTHINGNDFSAKTTKVVETYFENQVKGYELNLKTIDGTKEQIKGSDIDLVYKPGKEIKKALKNQNPFLWFLSFFSKSSNDVTVDVSYDKEKLAALVSGLNCVTAENQVPSANAVPTFDGTQFVITPEVIGNQVNIDNLNTAVNEAVTQFQTELNMEEKECYAFPQFTKDSPEVAAARDNMNKYIAASITYNMGDTPEVVDKTLISTWLSVDDGMNVVFNKEAVGAYLDEFCGKYNTVGATRNITTPAGKTAEVSGGIYGWKIDREKEYDTLIANIEAGEVVARDPVYSQTAASHGANDWGSTYIEVDLSTQQMWYVAEGNVAFQTAVVTGLPKNGRATPQGVNPILEKMRNKTLRGEKKPDGTYEYETPVDYWMRVTWTGIGFHDATWQPAFGGELYKTRGSHGCINMSHSDAATLYGLISVGTPVIIHY